MRARRKRRSRENECAWLDRGVLMWGIWWSCGWDGICTKGRRRTRAGVSTDDCDMNAKGLRDGSMPITDNELFYVYVVSPNVLTR